MADSWGGSFGIPSVWGVSFGDGSAPPIVVTSQVASLGGSKKRKVRGPYSDPRIYEEYIARCIVERSAPRESVEVAVLKEALVEEVQQRKGTGILTMDGLQRESRAIDRLTEIETTKKALTALAARQRSIETQIREIENEEASMALAFFNALED